MSDAPKTKCTGCGRLVLLVVFIVSPAGVRETLCLKCNREYRA